MVDPYTLEENTKEDAQLAEDTINVAEVQGRATSGQSGILRTPAVHVGGDQGMQDLRA